MKVEDIPAELVRLANVIDAYTKVGEDVLKEVNAGKVVVNVNFANRWFDMSTQAVLADLQTQQNAAIARHVALSKAYDDAQAALDLVNKG